MNKIRVGVQLHPQHCTYAGFAEAVRCAEEAGVDTIFHWDHFFPLSGDPSGNHFEAWTLLTAMATLTTRAEVGCLVTCNTYRNPNLLADMARTIDHISSGRLILGIGAGWFERDYEEYGYDFGTPATRLKALGRNLPAIIERFGKLTPPPTRHIPILIGGSGEKVTLRLTAQYADIWNTFGPLDEWKHKNQVLTDWCQKVGRDPAQIERQVMVEPDEIPGGLDGYVKAGASHFLVGLGQPFDMAIVEKLVQWREQANA